MKRDWFDYLWLCAVLVDIVVCCVDIALNVWYWE